MTNPVFPDKSQIPSSQELDAALGGAAFLLKKIEAYLETCGYSTSREWKFYSKAAGWTLAIRVKKRTVFHLLPGNDRFTVVFTLGKSAVAAAAEIGLPKVISALIANARVYAEGRSFRFDVAGQSDVLSVTKLAGVKLAN